MRPAPYVGHTDVPGERERIYVVRQRLDHAGRTRFSGTTYGSKRVGTPNPTLDLRRLRRVLRTAAAAWLTRCQPAQVRSRTPLGAHWRGQDSREPRYAA